MMIRFDGENLFASGPCRLAIGPLALRHAGQPALGGVGGHVAAQGVQGRSITQRGTLLADTPAGLASQRRAIEVKVDGQAHTLIDRFEASWPNVMMLRFEPGQAKRLGPRWQQTYRIDYEQTSPT
jgi:hypothetical protein